MIRVAHALLRAVSTFVSTPWGSFEKTCVDTARRSACATQEPIA
jgi:hypothetical protein